MGQELFNRLLWLSWLISTAPWRALAHSLGTTALRDYSVSFYHSHLPDFFHLLSHRKALLSLCLENAELKEQVGEAMLSEGWEKEDEKEDDDGLRLEVKKLREKLHTSEVVISLLREQLALNNQGSKGTFQSQVARGTQETEQPQMDKQCTYQGITQWHCPQLQDEESSRSHGPKGTRVFLDEFGSCGVNCPHSIRCQVAHVCLLIFSN